MYIIVYKDSLAHHGVKGMKWGVRKEQKFAAREKKWETREQRARTRIGKNISTYYKYSNRLAKENQAAANKSTTTKDKLRNKYGMESTARNNRLSAEYSRELAGRAKSQKARTKLESAAYNQEQFAKLHTRISKSTKSTIGRTFSRNGQIWSTKLKTAKGKDTTYAKQFVKAAAFTMAANAAITYAQMMLEDF